MARTILDEVLGFRPDFIEDQLAHAVRDPNGRAYNPRAFLPERRVMMQAWADYLDQLRAGEDIEPGAYGPGASADSSQRRVSGIGRTAVPSPCTLPARSWATVSVDLSSVRLQTAGADRRRRARQPVPAHPSRTARGGRLRPRRSLSRIVN